MATQYKTIQARQVITSLFFKGTKFFEISLYEDERGKEIEGQTSYNFIVPYGTGIFFQKDEIHNSLDDVFLTILKDKNEIEKLLGINIDEKCFKDFESKKDIWEFEELLIKV